MAGAEFDAAVRWAVFQVCLEKGLPPSVEQLMAELGKPRDAVEASLDRLDAARHLKLVPGTRRILMAFPFSGIATPYRVALDDGRQYCANCAWDALAFHPMLRRPIRVRSYCYHCAASVEFGVRDGQVDGSPAPPVVYLGLPAAVWWRDIVTTCANTMLFFASSQHLQEWRSSQPGAIGQELSLETVLRLSEPIYATKLERDYSRPSREKLIETFRELNLTGEFWKI